MIRIIIVDDHILFREGLAAILRQEAGIEVVGLAGSVQDAVHEVLRLKPDIVLMDFSLPDKAPGLGYVIWSVMKGPVEPPPYAKWTDN